MTCLVNRTQEGDILTQYDLLTIPFPSGLVADRGDGQPDDRPVFAPRREFRSSHWRGSIDGTGLNRK